MRPAGEIRQALLAAWVEGPATWRAMLPATGVDPCSPAEVRLVRHTVENMVRAGELEPCGKEKAAGSRVWCTVYERAPETFDAGSQAASFAQLGEVARSWAMFT